MPGWNIGLLDVDFFFDIEGIVPPTPPPPVVIVQPTRIVRQSVYQMRLYNTSGVLTAVFDTWNSVYFYNRVSDFGYHTISIDGNDPRSDLFQVDSIIEILRRNDSVDIPWYREYLGFHRTGQTQISDRGVKLFSSFGRGPEDLLNRRMIMYYAGGLNISNVPADTAMKLLMTYNAGPLATTGSGRIANGVMTGFTASPDANVGPPWSGDRSFKNLLDVIKEIGEASSVDFNVTWQGGQNFSFNTYYPQLGTDRSGNGVEQAVVFSQEHANMSEPYLTDSRMSEITSVFVLGQGEGTSRTVVNRINAFEANVSPWNLIEFTHDARNETSVVALQTIGDGHLIEHGLDTRVSFQVVSSPATVYGRDYFVGDRIKARLFGREAVRKVIGSEITVADGKENIRIHFEGEQ